MGIAENIATAAALRDMREDLAQIRVRLEQLETAHGGDRKLITLIAGHMAQLEERIALLEGIGGASD